MGVLLEIKQKLKNFYSRYEFYFMPLFKFGIGFAYFYWITQNLGFMQQLNNIYVLLILSLICCILPPGVMVFVGFVLMVGHAYAISLEAAAFLFVLILFLSIALLRFGSGQGMVLVCTPLAFSIGLPPLLPIGSSLLGSVLAAFPASAGVILYYFIRDLSAKAETLRSSGLEILDKVRLLADSLIQNWPMWLTLIAFVVTILLVNLVRTRSFDHSWKVAIFAGGICYILVMVGGSSLLDNVTVSIRPLLVQTALSMLISFVLEFLFFGGDYTRTERLEYEDDDYYYYVKAVPKAAVATTNRNIKRITSQQVEDRRIEEESSGRRKRRPARKKSGRENSNKKTVIEMEPEADVANVDFEKKLEESLKDL